MSELLLKLNVGLVIVTVGRCVINAKTGILIADNDFTIFIIAILWLLYKEEVGIASNVICAGCRQCDALNKDMRMGRGTAGSSWWLIRLEWCANCWARETELAMIWKWCQRVNGCQIIVIGNDSLSGHNGHSKAECRFRSSHESTCSEPAFDLWISNLQV